MRVMLFTETFLPKRDGIVTVICLLLDHLTKRGIHTAILAPYVADHLASMSHITTKPKLSACRV